MARVPAQAQGQAMPGRSWAMQKGQVAPRRVPAPRCCLRRRYQLLLNNFPRRRGAPGPMRS
eukprot:10678268-Lingulodinium_polyedra.AAC.1